MTKDLLKAALKTASRAIEGSYGSNKQLSVLNNYSDSLIVAFEFVKSEKDLLLLLILLLHFCCFLCFV